MVNDYHIAGIYYKSFNFASFMIGNALAKMKMSNVRLSLLLCIDSCGYNIQKSLLRAKIRPFTTISYCSKFLVYSINST